MSRDTPSRWQRPQCSLAWLALALCCTAAAWPPSTAFAERLSEIFDTANRAYFDADYRTAVSRYQSLIDAGVSDADVYFNLGTAHARLGAYGRAILAFERSLAIDPSESAARALSRARAAVGERLASHAGEATVRTEPPLAEAMLRPVSVDALGIWAVLLNATFFGLLFAWRRVRGDSLRIGLAISAAVSGTLLIAALLALSLKADWLTPGRRAVVVTDAVVREGPDAHAAPQGEAIEGERGRVLGREGDYWRVELAGGLEGWMPRGDIEPI